MELRKLTRFTISSVIGFLLFGFMVGFSVFASTPSFSDVKEGDWFYGYVTEAAEKKIVNGYADGTFKPSGNVNFAEALKIGLYTMQGNNGNSEWNSGAYADASGAWYGNIVNYFNTNGNDMNDNLNMNNPNASATRGEVMYVLMKAAGIDYEEMNGFTGRDLNHSVVYNLNVDFDSTFRDVDLRDDYGPYIQLAYDLDIVKGKGQISADGQKDFGTNDLITRAEVTKIALNIKALKDSGKLKKISQFKKGEIIHNSEENGSITPDPVEPVESVETGVKVNIENDILLKALFHSYELILGQVAYDTGFKVDMDTLKITTIPVANHTNNNTSSFAWGITNINQVKGMVSGLERVRNIDQGVWDDTREKITEEFKKKDLRGSNLERLVDYEMLSYAIRIGQDKLSVDYIGSVLQSIQELENIYSGLEIVYQAGGVQSELKNPLF